MAVHKGRVPRALISLPLAALSSISRACSMLIDHTDTLHAALKALCTIATVSLDLYQIHPM